MKKRLICIITAVFVLLNCFSSGIMLYADTENGLTQETSGDIPAVDNADDGNSFSAYFKSHDDAEYAKQSVIKNFDGLKLTTGKESFNIEVGQDAFYGIGMSYKTLNNAYSNITVGLKIDGEYPFSEAEKLVFARMWQNEGDSNRVDDTGNEFAPQQVEYKEFYYNEPICSASESNERYLVFLSKGIHSIELIPVTGEIQVEYFSFSSVLSAEKYNAPSDGSLYYKGENVVIEGEDALIKSSYFLTGKSDTSSSDVTPKSAENRKINYIGGGNWKTVGESLIWETPDVKEGYYQIGFSYRQNFLIGSRVYRKLTVDGKVPFSEAASIGFNYGDNWQKMFFADSNENPYLIYLTAGKHTVSLTVTAGEVADIRDKLTKASEELGRLYIDMTMITGETVDIYRDYELFKQISDMEERLISIRELLSESAKGILETTGEKSGSNYSIVMNMIQVIDQMLENKYNAHRYKGYYYTNYCSVSSVIRSLNEMPLSLDKIILTPVGAKTPFESSGFFEKISFGFRRFVITFIKDYDSISSAKGAALTVWVNWGRDQAQVLSSMLKNSFTPKSGIEVNLKLANASVVQATLTGKGPDCLLMQSRSEPVNLAMRGVLYDLSQFEDCEEVLTRFQNGADVPYRYKGGLYALPDTQNFFVMYYRKDILKQMGINVPKTWDEFSLAAKILMRNNMNVSLPNNAATSTEQVSGGVGSNNIFPTLLLQRKVPLYSENGKSTNLLSSNVMETMQYWTDFYRKQKFPITLDFYTRFRIGTTPIGISSYTFYTTLKAAASEIDGLWGMAPIPATVNEDGSVSNVTSGSGTACIILKSCKNKQAAWELLKWWTEKETQLSYSNEIEAILGPTGRIAVANVEAFKNLDWDNDAIEQLLSAWSNVEEIPEYPGSYYVARSIYQCFWNVVNANKNPKDMLMKYGKEADDEMARKWKQYANR